MTDLSGSNVGKYRLLMKLGTGGMAEVYEAYQPSLDRKVALKIIRPELAVVTDFRERFEREAKAVARLSHGNITRVFDFGEDQNRYYLVMEYIEGGNLKNHMQEASANGELIPYEEILAIIEKIGDALDYAHSENIIHRDVKPANILLTKRGRPMLTDFGIAKVIGERGLTQTGAAVGTPDYMAPEQIEGEKEKIGPASDIYSLGVILYEMVTGSTPFSADTPLAVLLKALNDPIPSPKEFRPDTPDAVEQVIFKALAKEPDERYQRASELSASLMEALVTEGIVSNTILSRISKLGESTTPRPATKETPPEISEEPLRPKKGLRLGWIGVAGVVVILAGLLGAFFLRGGFQAGGVETPTVAQTEPAALLPELTDTPSPNPTPDPTDATTPVPVSSPTASEPPTDTPPPAQTPTEIPPTQPINAIDGADIILIPEGGFQMGSNRQLDRFFAGAEGPIHPVFLNAYYIYRNEVTTRMYVGCVEAGDCNEPLAFGPKYRDPVFADHPMVFVSWEEATAYCAWAGGRLPTEAEWEKAARGDKDERLFPWGDTDPTGEQANYCDRNCPVALKDPTQDDGFEETAPVGSFPEGASPYGVLDMAGNVREWTQDWFLPTYYSRSPEENPTGPATGETRVTRGGSFIDRADGIRVVFRRSEVPVATRQGHIGFRCAVDVGG